MPLEPLKLFGTTFSSWVKRAYCTHWRGRGCEVAWRERRDESGSGGVSTHGVLRRSCGGAWASQPRVLVSNRNERTCRNLTSESDTGRNPSAHGLQVQGSHFDALAAVGQGTNDQSETLNGVSASLCFTSRKSNLVRVGQLGEIFGLPRLTLQWTKLEFRLCCIDAYTKFN
jgi:hypothetical protein